MGKKKQRHTEVLRLAGAILPYDSPVAMGDYQACFHAGAFKKTLGEHSFPGVSDGPRGLFFDNPGMELHFQVICDHWSITSGAPRRELHEIALVAVLPAERPAGMGDGYQAKHNAAA